MCAGHDLVVIGQCVYYEIIIPVPYEGTASLKYVEKRKFQKTVQDKKVTVPRNEAKKDCRNE